MKTRAVSSTPSSRAASICERLVGQSCAWRPPPRQRSAAAERTAWRVPPIPIERWSFVPRIAAEIDAVTVPSPISLIRVPGRPELLDEVVVPRPVEHERGDVDRLAVEALRDGADVVGDGAVEVDHAPGARPDGDRPHVHVGKLEERALGRDREHRDRTDAAPRDDASSLDRVEREVDAIAACADLSSRCERLAGPRADHDPPVDRHLVERGLHPVRRGLLGCLLVGAAEPARARERGPLRRPRVASAHAVRHRVTRGYARTSRSAVDSTRSRTSPIAWSSVVFMITGTSQRRARSMSASWMKRISGIPSMYFSSGRSPSVA